MDGSLNALFSFIDDAGVDGGTGEAVITLGSNVEMTVRAGGPGIQSWPARPAFQQYEVMLDGDVPRFWTRYGDDFGGALFARVPKLLITHHVVRSGGIREAHYERYLRERAGVFKVQMLLSEMQQNAILDAISSVKGVRLMSSDFVTG